MASDERNKRLRTSTSGDTCVTCSRDVEETGIECNWCYHWEHYDCAGLSEGEYSMLSNSSSKIMFFCTWCYNKVPFALKIEKEAQSNKEMFEANFTTINTKLSELHSNVAAIVKDLELKLGEHHKSFTNTLTNHPIQMSTNPVLTTISEESVAHMGTKSPQVAKADLRARNKKLSKTQIIPEPSTDRKFNVVVFGVPECKSETTRLERLAKDSSNVISIFQKINSNLNESAIHDCFRLGRYNQSRDRSRPILVKLNRTIDVANILSNKSSCPENISIKPDLSPREREIDALLMKKRWSLIQSGVDCKLIRIKKSSLYIQDTLYGRVENSSFHVVANNNASPKQPTVADINSTQN